MLRWYPGILLQVVLELTFVPIAFFSIFAVNGLVDRDTPWAIGGLSGTATSPAFWLIIAALVVGWTLLVLGWRGAGTLFKWLLVPWHLALSTAAIGLVLQPGDLEMRGESVDFSLSLELFGPLFAVLTLILAVAWIIRDARHGTPHRSVSPMQRRNKLAACCTVVGLAVAAAAFGTDYEQVGTVAGILTALAAHEVMRPLNPSKELHKALLLEGSAPQ